MTDRQASVTQSGCPMTLRLAGRGLLPWSTSPETSLHLRDPPLTEEPTEASRGKEVQQPQQAGGGGTQDPLPGPLAREGAEQRGHRQGHGASRGETAGTPSESTSPCPATPGARTGSGLGRPLHLPAGLRGAGLLGEALGQAGSRWVSSTTCNNGQESQGQALKVIRPNPQVGRRAQGPGSWGPSGLSAAPAPSAPARSRSLSLSNK